jgi:hypothetical protein
MIMRAHGHASVWRTHIGVGRATDDTGWYQRLRHWWTPDTAARREANLTSRSACWNGTREVVTPFRAEAAPDMAAAPCALAVVTLIYGLAV